MWAYMLPHFRCTHKTQYAPMAVHVLYMNDMMSPEVKAVWQQHRTASLSGNPGRLVGWDYVLERMNNEFKRLLDGHVTRERLDSCALLLNGLKVIDADISSSWGVEHPDEPDQYTHVRPEDVNEVVRQLEVLLGATRAEVANKASHRNKFGTGSAPWQDIWDGDGMRDLDDFIRRHLGGLVSGE